jgi:putative endonuclease
MARSHPLPTDLKRKRAEKAGRRAEEICAIWLRLKGYRILATRYKSPVGEIDIMAKRGSTLIAVEVKSRATRETALHSVRPDQQNRIARALETYAGRIGHRGDLRFDLMIVHGRAWFGRIEHLRNAWHGL